MKITYENGKLDIEAADQEELAEAVAKLFNFAAVAYGGLRWRHNQGPMQYELEGAWMVLSAEENRWLTEVLDTAIGDDDRFVEEINDFLDFGVTIGGEPEVGDFVRFIRGGEHGEVALLTGKAVIEEMAHVGDDEVWEMHLIKSGIQTTAPRRFFSVVKKGEK